MSLKDKLKLIRHELNWSQEQAANECRVSLSLWRKMERDDRENPTLNTLVRIITTYNKYTANKQTPKEERKGLDWLVDYCPNWGLRL